MSDLTEICRGRWDEIFTALGLLDSKALSHRHVPCPMCGGKDRFHYSDRDRVGVWHCRTCGGGDGFNLIQAIKGVDFPRAAKLVETIVGRARWNRTRKPRNHNRPESRPEPPRPTSSATTTTTANGNSGATTTAEALALWRQTVDPRGTRAEVYLNSRELSLSDELINQRGASLRWHPGIGALVALFRNIRTDAPQAVLRTFIDEQGKKIGRKFLGPVADAAVKLDRDEDVLEGLHVCEGVETGLAARQYNLRPCWALGTAGAIERFPVLDGVQALTMLGESGCQENERAIQACGIRWQDAGRQVEVIYPDAGKDLNDLLMGETP
jgi:hypothetical protein